MVEQYRIAADKISLEFPMGQVEGKDNPEEIARQELLEETGYTAQKMIHLSKFHQSPGWSTQIGHIFVAEDLTAGKAEPEEFEFVQNRLVKISEIDDLIADGTIFGMPTIAALYYYRALYGKNAENVR
jgi:ADP-ribose pyrophosphatase